MMKLGPTVTCPRAGPLHQAKYLGKRWLREETQLDTSDFQSYSAEMGEHARRTTSSAALCQPGLSKRPLTAHPEFAEQHSKDSESLRKTIFRCSETNNITH